MWGFSVYKSNTSVQFDVYNYYCNIYTQTCNSSLYFKMYTFLIVYTVPLIITITIVFNLLNSRLTYSFLVLYKNLINLITWWCFPTLYFPIYPNKCCSWLLTFYTILLEHIRYYLKRRVRIHSCCVCVLTKITEFMHIYHLISEDKSEGGNDRFLVVITYVADV